MALEKTFNVNHMKKVRCSHILISYDEAINSSHSRGIYFAVFEAKAFSTNSNGTKAAKMTIGNPLTGHAMTKRSPDRILRSKAFFRFIIFGFKSSINLHPHSCIR